MSAKSKTLIIVTGAIIGLLFSRLYIGPGSDFFTNYGTNISFSFAAYFILKLFNLPINKLAAGGIIFFIVSLQEIAQGIGLYPGNMDSLDYLFNAVGVVLAIILDTIIFGKDTK
ncbi:MAG: hypothetical protein R3250_11570 [Melioribacteraceae bacterium]|nr:hypothetical protein [Melioribacteraceae bacterium]